MTAVERTPPADGSEASHSTQLPRYFAAVYGLMIVYASLEPFSGWMAPPADMPFFLFGPLPARLTRFDAIINVVAYAPFGFFVELREVFVEGLVHVTTLGGDFYEHVEAQHLLRGRRTRRTYRVGDPVTVRVAGASVERRAIDFVVANGEVEEPWRRRRRRS